MDRNQAVLKRRLSQGFSPFTALTEQIRSAFAIQSDTMNDKLTIAVEEQPQSHLPNINHTDSSSKPSGRQPRDWS